MGIYRVGDQERLAKELEQGSFAMLVRKQHLRTGFFLWLVAALWVTLAGCGTVAEILKQQNGVPSAGTSNTLSISVTSGASVILSRSNLPCDADGAFYIKASNRTQKNVSIAVATIDDHSDKIYDQFTISIPAGQSTSSMYRVQNESFEQLSQSKLSATLQVDLHRPSGGTSVALLYTMDMVKAR